ncbi:MAG: hypothetical protein QHC67_03610 [Sphingobium sp.]|uniref:hypothetical protein n=1 Tax=Sphingobium sp. TaxID=1912891 RepID=UPI0029BF8C97|nr:hypothetical protein [Sphingobium sp.]MDX3908886.1 hypothetical protein [Sphingobium sp.]
MAKPSIADQLERASDDLDQVICSARLGVRNARQFDDLEEQAQGIAAKIVAAFRGEQAPQAKPLRMDIVPDGKSSAWY